MAETTAPEIIVSRDGQQVAILRMGQEPEIAPGPHAEDLRHRLEQPRFVRRPDTKAMVWSDNMPHDDPAWWVARVGDATWPLYEIAVK